MRRGWFWSLLLFALAAGFLLGRASDTGVLPAFPTDGADIPLFPKPPKDLPGVQPVPQDGEIIVETPVQDAVLTDPLLDVTGRAKVAGGPLKVSVKDAAGNEIASAKVDIFSESGDYGRFGNTFAFAVRPTGAATVEIARQSGEGATVTRKVTFTDAPAPGSTAPAGSGDTVTLRAFFANERQGSAEACEKVFPVDRAVPAKTAGYRAIIEELLKGPTDGEKGEGYLTSIPGNAALKSVAADAQGVVTADFTAALDRNIGGSCRVTSIRAQIETTLKQFPEVRSVVISVNGRTEDVLQP